MKGDRYDRSIFYLKRKCIPNVRIHITKDIKRNLPRSIAHFHADVIERRLRKSNLAAEDKIFVLNKVSENIRNNLLKSLE